MRTLPHWTEYRWRVELDAIFASALSLLHSMGDEEGRSDLEKLRRRNIARMGRIQSAAYRTCADALGETG